MTTTPPRPSPTKIFHSTAYPAIDPTRPELTAKGKNVVVTGGGTGIGAETARYFAKAGASSIAILGRREKPLQETRASIQRDFPNVRVFTASTDVTNKHEVDAAFAEFLGDAKLHVLVNSAATIGAIGNVKDLESDQWFQGIEADVKGAFIITQAFLRYATQDAVFINVSSAVVHLNVRPGGSAYSVSKAAVQRFLSAVAFEHPELCIFNIQPGAIDTEMSRTAGIPARHDISLPASFIVWLAGPDSRFLKGRFLWANWDVEELKGRATEIESSTLLDIGLIGWPFSG